MPIRKPTIIQVHVKYTIVDLEGCILALGGDQETEEELKFHRKQLEKAIAALREML